MTDLIRRAEREAAPGAGPAEKATHGRGTATLLPAILVALLLLFGGGCAETGPYLANRALDFVDIFSVKVGGGFGVSSGVDFCGVFSVYAGFSKVRRSGFEGRSKWVKREEHVVLGPPFHTIAVPILSLIRGDIDKYDNPVLGTLCWILTILYPGGDKIYPSREIDEDASILESFGAFSTADLELALYQWGAFFGFNDEEDDPLDRGLRAYDLRVHVCVFLSIEIGVNPLEALDFALGWLGIDVMGDDEE